MKHGEDCMCSGTGWVDFGNNEVVSCPGPPVIRAKSLDTDSQGLREGAAS